MNYYNENDKKTAAWIRELVAARLVPRGDVDERSICDVQPGDLKGYTQCHFFAGICGWSLALQLAGWPSDKPVWTGSCPCQPFSTAGKGLGDKDERHLWPVFASLIRSCKPPVCFGEQVASKAGRAWLAGVFADLEGMGYQRAGADLCAASKLAPHPRQRLFWVADSNGKFDLGKELPASGRKSEIPSIWKGEENLKSGQGRVDELVARRATKRVSSYSDAMLELDGIPGRMVIMRGAGNAIVPQVAAEFIASYMDITQ